METPAPTCPPDSNSLEHFKEEFWQGIVFTFVFCVGVPVVLGTLYFALLDFKNRLCNLKHRLCDLKDKVSDSRGCSSLV